MTKKGASRKQRDELLLGNAIIDALLEGPAEMHELPGDYDEKKEALRLLRERDAVCRMDDGRFCLNMSAAPAERILRAANDPGLYDVARGPLPWSTAVRPGDWTDNHRWSVLSGVTLDRIKQVRDDIVGLHLLSPPFYKYRDYGPGQMGNEATPTLYIEGQIEVLREAKRTCAPHGTIWYNIQDKRENGETHGIPHSIAHLAKHELGLVLVNDVIWGKDACQPYSGGRGMALAHEYIFVFAKSKSFYWNGLMTQEHGGRTMQRVARTIQYFLRRKEPWQKGHDAVFPLELAKFVLRCGLTPHGQCGQCGEPVEDVVTRLAREADEIKRRLPARRKVVGAAPRCGHAGPFAPSLVMDMFCGTATTGMAGLPHGNVRFLGIENNPKHFKRSVKNLGSISPGFRVEGGRS